MNELAGWIRDARRGTEALAAALGPGTLLGPRLPIVNPPLWELGHVAWFQERWVLRHGAGAPPLRADGDALYDSIAVPHDARWDLPLPSLPETLAYLAEVERRVLRRLEGADPSDADLVRLAVLHEDMHVEAMAFSRQTLGWPAPALAGLPGAEAAPAGAGLPGDLEVEGGTVPLGAPDDGSFAFDNERPAREVALAPFRIARAPVTQGAFAAFVADGGYRRPELWTPEGWRWRERAGAEHPVHWRPSDGGWERAAFDRRIALEPLRPVVNVCWWEADAFCRWAGRRLPSEAEWETAERRGLPGVRQVWEWTASDFLPYPGFAPGLYREYSAPWFGSHKVLRGGSSATPARLLRPSFRNFYTPDRRDPWAGLRTCAC